MCVKKTKYYGYQVFKSGGMTLIELIIAMVIISTASMALLNAMAISIGSSADPMLRQQSLSLAKAYMEEIQLKNFIDPISLTVCPPAVGLRNSFDNVCDYNGLSNSPPQDQFGNNIITLSNYQVDVVVSTSTGLGGLTSADTLRIDISVTDPSNDILRLSGYRASY